jgi:putative membrane protein
MPDRLFTGAIAAPLAQMMGGDGGMGWGIVMMVAMVLVTVLVIVGVIWLVRGLLRERDRASPDDGDPPNALRVLDRRFAAGEIDAEEYRDRRSVLERGR